MLSYLLKRVIGLVLVVIAVTFVTFFMGYIAPGEDPVSALLGNHQDPTLRHQLIVQYGFDQPWFVQYGHFLLNLAQGNFGLSYFFQGTPVSELIGPKIAVSLELGLLAFLISLAIGIPVGIIAAVRRDSATDTLLMGMMLFLYAIPSFVIIPFYQVAMVFLYQHNLPNLPVAGWGDLTSVIAPALILAFTSMGYYSRLTRTVMLEVLGQDYVRTARAKGVSERAVVYVHALRNAMLPLLSVIGPSLAFIVSGAFVVEVFFAIPGIGYQSVQSIPQRDWPVLQATVVILAVAVVVMNLVTDIFYSIADPRIRITEGG